MLANVVDLEIWSKMGPEIKGSSERSFRRFLPKEIIELSNETPEGVSDELADF